MISISDVALLCVLAQVDLLTRASCMRVSREWRRVACDVSLWRGVEIYTSVLDAAMAVPLLTRIPSLSVCIGFSPSMPPVNVQLSLDRSFSSRRYGQLRRDLDAMGLGVPEAYPRVLFMGVTSPLCNLKPWMSVARRARTVVYCNMNVVGLAIETAGMSMPHAKHVAFVHASLSRTFSEPDTIVGVPTATLETLVLKNVDFPSERLVLPPPLPALRNLQIWGMATYWRNGAAVRAILRSSPRLERVGASEIGRMTLPREEAGDGEELARLKWLSTAYLDRVHATDLVALVRSSPRLRRLRVSVRGRERGVETVDPVLQAIQDLNTMRAEHIEELTFSSSFDLYTNVNAAESLNDQFFRALCGALPRLKRLALVSTPAHVDDASLWDCMHCFGRTLEVLDVSMAWSIVGDALVRVVTDDGAMLPRLHTVHVDPAGGVVAHADRHALSVALAVFLLSESVSLWTMVSPASVDMLLRMASPSAGCSEPVDLVLSRFSWEQAAGLLLTADAHRVRVTRLIVSKGQLRAVRSLVEDGYLTHLERVDVTTEPGALRHLRRPDGRYIPVSMRGRNVHEFVERAFGVPRDE
jgi:hypothetical protein